MNEEINDDAIMKSFEERKKIMMGEKKDPKKLVKEILEEHDNKLKEKLNFGFVWEILDKLIVGEDNNKAVLFLNALSCKLKQPNGTIITSEASAGKSHLVREVLKLFPDEWKIIFGGASKKALIHMKGRVEKREGSMVKIIDFTGKILWFLEDSGGEESYKILRPILSRDQEEIRFELSTKKRGKKGSEFFANDVILVKGCPAYITTTTKQERLPEMGTRVFLLSMDESREQSQRILEWKARKKQFLIEDPKDMIEELKNYLKKLKSYDVWIPFADLIQISAENLNVRRDIDKIFALLEAYTLFNQFDRQVVEINGKKYLVPKLDDLWDVLDIAIPVLNPTLMNMPRKILTFYEKLRELDKKGSFDVNEEVRDSKGNIIDSKIRKEITHKKIAELLKINQNTVRLYCWQLVNSGRLTSWKEKNQNHYAFLEVNNAKDVTIVTKSEVTPNLIGRSLEKVKSYISQTVTDVHICRQLLNYIYNISVTDNTNTNFDSTEPETPKFRGTTLKSNNGNKHHTLNKKITNKIGEPIN